MFEDVDQHEATICPDGSVTFPAAVLEALRWRAGMRVLIERTDDGVLITEIEVPALATIIKGKTRYQSEVE